MNAEATPNPLSWHRSARDHKIASLQMILRERERELLEAKGPCTTASCSLHYAHSGPCNGRAVDEEATR